MTSWLQEINHNEFRLSVLSEQQPQQMHEQHVHQQPKPPQRSFVQVPARFIQRHGGTQHVFVPQQTLTTQS